MESASSFLENNLLILGSMIILGLIIAVIFAALKHAVVRQLESKVSELKDVLTENTANIANKQRLLDSKTEAHDELKRSLKDLSNRHTDLRHDFNTSQKSLSSITESFEQLQKEQIETLQNLANNQKEYELSFQAEKNQHEQKLLNVQKEADQNLFSFKENYKAEFEHLKKSHKRLVQANQTMSKNVENLRSERDFYRTEFQTLRNFLHDSQMDKAKELVEEHAKQETEGGKIVRISQKGQD